MGGARLLAALLAASVVLGAGCSKGTGDRRGYEGSRGPALRSGWPIRPRASADGPPRDRVAGEPGGGPGSGALNDLGVEILPGLPDDDRSPASPRPEPPARRAGTAPPGNRVFSEKDWLARHQSADGAWRNGEVHLRCVGPACGGPGPAGEEVRTTALAVLCYLRYGETHKTPRYGAQVRGGVKYLKAVQDPDGVLGFRAGPRWIENHAVGTLALGEIHRLTESPLFKTAARRAVDALLLLQGSDGGWRRGDDSFDSGVSATAWAALALAAARSGGLLEFPAGEEERLHRFLASSADPRTGRIGEDRWPAFRDDSRGVRHPLPPRETAMAVLARFVGGSSAKGDPMVEAGLKVLLDHLPARDEPGGPADPVYVQFATLACFHAGGETWKRWNAAMKRALLDAQIMDKGSCAYGSWEVVPGPAADEGRIGVTAFSIQSLCTYYRWSRCFCDGPK